MSVSLDEKIRKENELLEKSESLLEKTVKKAMNFTRKKKSAAKKEEPAAPKEKEPQAKAEEKLPPKKRSGKKSPAGKEIAKAEKEAVKTFAVQNPIKHSMSRAGIPTENTII